MLLNKSLLNEIELKEILTDINSGNKTWQQEDQTHIIQSMMLHIGSLDSELRDDLIYGSLYELILEKNLLEHSLLTELLDCSLKNLIFKGITESESDLVFTRTFTSLLIALILNRDIKDDFLSKDQINDCKDQLLAYLSAETDVRGYVPGKGWAHSVAHMADAIDELVKNPKLNKASYIEIVSALWNAILQENYAFIHDEDERILIPIFTMLEHGLEEQEIIKLLEELPITLKGRKEQLDVQHHRILRFNCKAFLKSFYIKTNGKPKFVALHKSIEACLDEITRK
ncbi:DUF2785 domain-containing protein [Lysinibacillus xylanilyticus]|uniref:DUF2785 domain-containing protein n=1 Tax=Lysinibacillus xylanilyticus TaxID=582475 RepID=UPI002B24ACB9|nr:DUF2785 domain-containing protein [Lysinibacillus xylanilyticus]MEB2298716.1 DUF2785 domain-containing protein [Lysinibacillus xylanilyticus]